MREKELIELFESVKNGRLAVSKAVSKLKDFPIKKLSFANIDTHREVRSGFPEVVFCKGKTPAQSASIIKEIVKASGYCLATRAEPDTFKAVKKNFSSAEYNEKAKTIVVKKKGLVISRKGLVLVVTAGTSDIPVAEEAAVTAEITGSKVERVFDVGVAGIHRLLSHYERIRSANVIVAVAGMEGALPSVVGGLVDRPVIAVPTSIGYGASFGGVSALLTMLNSCASNVVTVNIDNGFGAGYVASIINKMTAG
ncbi:MAG: nickel pincer cofactor biosynthesis protein LarB [Candidatus Firestonebacteria bacterium]